MGWMGMRLEEKAISEELVEGSHQELGVAVPKRASQRLHLAEN